MLKYYKWQDIDIKINTNRSEILELIRDKTFLEEIKTTNTFNIELTVYDLSIEAKEYIKIHKEAILNLDQEIELEGSRKYKTYQLKDEYWSVFENYGRTYLDVKQKKIVCEVNDYSQQFSIYILLLFIIHPLNKVLNYFNYYRLHAACIKINNKNILITGLSGRGKSTATFALLNAGGKVLSDEMPLIKISDNRVIGYPIYKIIKVQQDAVNKFFNDNIHNYDYLQFEDEYYINIFENEDKWIPKADNIDAIFILNRTGINETKIKKISPIKVVQELFPVTVSVESKNLMKRTFTNVMKMLNIIDAYQIDFGTDMKDFVREIKKLLE